MTQENLKKQIWQAFHEWLADPENISLLDDKVMPIINQYIEQIIGEDEHHFAEATRRPDSVLRNELRAEMRKRAGLEK